MTFTEDWGDEQMDVSIQSATGEVIRQLSTKLFDSETGFPLFSDKNYEGVQFSGGIFNKLAFELCSLDDSYWLECSISNVRFFGDIMMGANFCRANFENVEFYGVTGLKNSFRNSFMQGVQFAGACMKQADFSEANMKNVRFECDNIGGTSSIEGASFFGAKFSNVTFIDTLYNKATKFPDGYCSMDVPGLRLVE